MAISKITSSEIDERLVKNLPTKPNAPTSQGGRGYSAEQLKSAFDALPLLIAERFNALVEDLSLGEESDFTSLIKTGITDTQTLKELLSDIKNSEILNYIFFDGEPLFLLLATIKNDVESIKEKVYGGGA